MADIRKMLSAALAFSLMLSAAGCGGRDPSASSDGSETESSFSPENNAAYTPYDEDKRIDDERELTAYEYSVFNTVATDDFGRTFVTVDGAEENKYVGMFYFLCLGQDDNHNGIYDISVITENGENDAAFQVNDSSSPLNAAHFWGEPVYGYYNSLDPWVMRKQIELLTMAGVDFLVFDVSNAKTYKSVTDTLFEIMQEYYDAGWKVPKFMYYTAYDSGAGQNKNTIAEVYNNYYKEGKYKDLWFCPYEDGKPLITRHQNTVYAEGDEIGEFFHFRYRQWPNEAFNAEGIPWIEFSFPQLVHNGWMSVSVAQHAKTVRFSDKEGNPGRGATWYGAGATSYFINDSENYRRGPNYEQQWDNLIDNKTDVDFAFVTGWNEWVATKMSDSDGRYFTVDQYNAEYSRDIEPSRTDGLGDNFLLQTVRKIREYKSTEAKHYKYPSTTISTDCDDEQWENVSAAYMDFVGECADRNFKPFNSGGRNLRNTTGRNDIESVKVAKDGEYLYFRVACASEITEYESGDTDWMNIWIKTANGAGKTLNGYNYVINRSVSGSAAAVMRTEGKESVRQVGEGGVYVYGKVMIVKVPLAVLGLSADDYSFEFKVTDNVNFDQDYLNLYDTGDAAPCGRFNFSYGY